MDILHRDEHGSFHKLSIGVVTGYGKEEAKMTLQVKLPYLKEGDDVIENVAWMIPYGGDDYGVLLRPEIGDQVVLAFLGMHEVHAIALGCINGPASTMFNDVTDKNEKKLWKSKGGACIEIWDEREKERIAVICKELEMCMKEEEKILILKDKEDKNSILLDAKSGKVEVKAAEEIAFLCGKSKVQLHKDGSIEMQGESLSIAGTALHAKMKEELALKGMKVKIEANEKLECEGKGSLDIKSSGITEISGGLLKLG